VVAPAGTPADIVTQLNRHIGQFLRNPDIQQRLLALGLAISGTDTAETTAEFIRQQQASWRSLAQEIDLRPE
jgi:tripartite-type tricarboxylate transporter receptor subunit TctC